MPKKINRLAAAFTDAELAAYADEHIAYEVRMLVRQTEAFEARPVEHDMDPVWRALFEATLVHLRLLDDFLGKSSRDDDIKACNYIAKWKGGGFLSRSNRSRINAQAAHLSTERRANHYWPIGQLITDCRDTLVTFISGLPPERRPWFINAATHLGLELTPVGFKIVTPWYATLKEASTSSTSGRERLDLSSQTTTATQKPVIRLSRNDETVIRD